LNSPRCKSVIPCSEFDTHRTIYAKSAKTPLKNDHKNAQYSFVFKAEITIFSYLKFLVDLA